MEASMPTVPDKGVNVPQPTAHPGQYTTKELVRLAEYYLGANETLPPAWQRELLARLKN